MESLDLVLEGRIYVVHTKKDGGVEKEEIDGHAVLKMLSRHLALRADADKPAKVAKKATRAKKTRS